jgi:integrase
VKGKRDRAILATFLFHSLRCEELCSLCVRDAALRRGVVHLRVHGKGDEVRFVSAHPAALERISD